MASFHKDFQFTIEDNVLEGKELFHREDFTSLGEFVLRRLEENPDLVGQVDAITDEEYTHRTMRDRSVRCALWMQSQGFRPGDVIGVCSDHHMDDALPCFAALYLGAVFSLWDVKVDADGLSRRMNITRPKFVFVSGGVAAVVAEAAKKMEANAMKIIVFGHVPGFLEFDAVIAEPGIDEVKEFGYVPIQTSDEIASIIFSSGTTGPPKGVALSHRALTMLMRQSRELGMPGNVCLTFAANDWITTVESMLMSLLLKVPRIIVPSFEAHSACTIIEKYKANWVLLTTCMIKSLLNSNVTDKYDLSSVTRVVYSGAQVYIASYRALTELMPQAQIISGYGLTEACGYITIQSVKSQPCSCGEITENAKLKVIDPDSGRTLGPNQNGELLLKFPAMMSCYYGDPEATAQAIDEDGWLHSKDLGYYDKDGEVFLVDRMQDIIRCGDSEISPSDIEGVITSHPGVKEAAVVGQPRYEDSDLLIAFVVRAEDYSDTRKPVTEADIMNLVAAELPKSHHLRAGVRFIDEIPKTHSDKIRRTALRDLAKST